MIYTIDIDSKFIHLHGENDFESILKLQEEFPDYRVGGGIV